MNWRTKTESKIELFSDWLFENAKITIVVIFVLVAGIASQLPSLKIDTTTEGFLHKSDPMRVQYDEFRDQFGRDEKLMIAVKTQNIFDCQKTFVLLYNLLLPLLFPLIYANPFPYLALLNVFQDNQQLQYKNQIYYWSQ